MNTHRFPLSERPFRGEFTTHGEYSPVNVLSEVQMHPLLGRVPCVISAPEFRRNKARFLTCCRLHITTLVTSEAEGRASFR